MRPRLLLIVNPNAGKTGIRSELLRIIDIFVKGGYEVTVRTTQKAYEIPEILEQTAGGYSMVVCCGGDGTLNETLNGLMPLKEKPLLGFIPMGTVNDFAASLAIPKKLLGAARLIVGGDPFTVDIGLFGDRYFSYCAGFGAFTAVSYSTSQKSKRLLGRAAYLLAGVKAAFQIKSLRVTIEHDGVREEGDYIMGMITNSVSVGGFQLEKGLHASLTDGLLEVNMVRKPRSLAAFAAVVKAVMFSKSFRAEGLTSFKTERLTVSSQAKMPWTLDGEYGGCPERVEISAVGGAVRIMTPAGFAKKAQKAT